MALQDTDAAAELRVRADAGQLGVIRAVAATMAAQCDFDLDEMADVRLAADEAASFLIVRGQPNTQLICKFLVQPGLLEMSVSSAINETVPPAQRGFGWHVLTTLTDTVELHQTPGSDGVGGYLSTIEFTKRSVVGADVSADGQPSTGSGSA